MSTHDRLRIARERSAEKVGLEADYWKAAVRILEGRATRLKPVKGKVKLSQESVAIEAGHSRTPISGKGALFPELRDFTKRNPVAKDSTFGGGGDTELLFHYSQTIKLLTLQRDLFATRLAEAENLVRIKQRALKALQSAPQKPK